MKRNSIILCAGILGLIVGFISAHSLLIRSWVALPVWGIIGLAAGYFIPDRNKTVLPGLVYGFVLCAAFLAFGYQGSRAQIPGFLMLLLVISLVGAAGGLALFRMGNFIRLHRTAGFR